MSTLPTHRDLSPTPTINPGPSTTQVDLRPPASDSSASTHVAGDDEKGKGTSSDGGYDEKAGVSSNAAYVDKGLIDIEFEEGKRKVQVVLEQKSGKEMIKELGGGPYTQPRWCVAIVQAGVLELMGRQATLPPLHPPKAWPSSRSAILRRPACHSRSVRIFLLDPVLQLDQPDDGAWLSPTPSTYRSLEDGRRPIIQASCG